MTYIFLSEVRPGMLILSFHRPHDWHECSSQTLHISWQMPSKNWLTQAMENCSDMVLARFDMSCARNLLVSFFRRLPIKSKENILCCLPCKNTMWIQRPLRNKRSLSPDLSFFVKTTQLLEHLFTSWSSWMDVSSLIQGCLRSLQKTDVNGRSENISIVNISWPSMALVGCLQFVLSQPLALSLQPLLVCLLSDPRHLISLDKSDPSHGYPPRKRRQQILRRGKKSARFLTSTNWLHGTLEIFLTKTRLVFELFMEITS